MFQIFCDPGHDEESSVVSCGNDVGDVHAVELEAPVDPGTTIDIKFSVLHLVFLPFLTRCGF